MQLNTCHCLKSGSNTVDTVDTDDTVAVVAAVADTAVPVVPFEFGASRAINAGPGVGPMSMVEKRWKVIGK